MRTSAPPWAAVLVLVVLTGGLCGAVATDRPDVEPAAVSDAAGWSVRVALVCARSGGDAIAPRLSQRGATQLPAPRPVASRALPRIRAP